MPSKFRVPSATQFRLASYDTADTEGLTEPECERILAENQTRIAELQNVLYAEDRRSLLVVLQAMDTGGKDPIIRDVFSAANPQACRVTAFKKAGGREAEQDRFWRFHHAAPGKGEIGVFNRAYYDDTIRSDAHGELDEEALSNLYRHICNFERVLADQDVTILKVFLYISKEEQRVRLQERIDTPSRHWELSESDFTERKFWDGYMRAYESAIRQTHTDYAPWYLVTSDRKWFRDAAASILIREALEEMNPQFPPSSVDLSQIEWD